jgi:hypothetical protein
MPKMKLADWARENGLSYITAHRHFHAGMIPNAQQLDSGTILVDTKDASPEQGMSSSSNDAMSLFLKKTVEFSKNGSSVEDFAAFVISNFQLKLNGVSEGPKYSKQKPKSEDVQKHFQQFIPKGEKPKPNSFVMDPKAFEDISAANTTVTRVDVDQTLLKEFTQAVETPAPPPGFFPTYNPVAASTPGAAAGSTSAEGVVTRSVDLNTTPQPINYTGSNNPAFSSSLNFAPNASTTVATNSVLTTSSNLYASGINSVSYMPEGDSGVYFNSSLAGGPYASLDEIGENFGEEPTKTLESKTSATLTSATLGLNQPRKRGRKPSKR